MDLAFPEQARCISYDGSVVGGDGFRWTESGGIEAVDGDKYDLSADGSIMVGTSGGNAVIWDQVGGMRNLQSILEDDHGLDQTEWTLTTATSVSANGLVIAGTGTDPFGHTKAWRATVPEPSAIALLAMGALKLGVLSVTRVKKGG